MYKHSHTCVNSKNKYSEIEISPNFEIKGVGVTKNILNDTFTNGEVIISTFSDDCFFNIKLNNKSELKNLILGIIRMHQVYIKEDVDCIKEPDISDQKIDEIINTSKVSFKTIGSRVVILNKHLNLLEQKLPKLLIKESCIIYG